MKPVLAAVAALALASASFIAAAADLDAGVRAYRARDFSTAVAQLAPLAELGDPDAAFYLGSLYNRDDGGHKDDHQAYKLLSRAARTGWLDAQDALIGMRARGKVSLMMAGYALRPSESQALAAHREAARSGRFDAMDSAALTRLAVAYCENMALEDPAQPGATARIARNDEVVGWLQRAANDGQPQAQFMLAQLYLGGQPCFNVKIDIDRALGMRWLRKAAEQGVLAAQRHVATMALHPMPGTDATLSEGKEWLRKAAARNDAPAIAWLGVYYSSDAGQPKDAAEAVRLYRQAADLDDLTALNSLATLLLRGDPTSPADPVQMFALFKRSAELSDPYAQRVLADMYARGVGVEKNAEQSLKWRTASARGGDATSRAQLAQMYLTGRDVPADPKVGLDWLRGAASAGQPQALMMLGVLYESGSGGVPRDAAKAFALHTLAVRAGHAAAAQRRDALQPGMAAGEVERGTRLADAWQPDTRRPGDWNWRALSVGSPPPEDRF